jgi:hypothetical protein
VPVDVGGCFSVGVVDVRTRRDEAMIFGEKNFPQKTNLMKLN